MSERKRGYSLQQPKMALKYQMQQEQLTPVDMVNSIGKSLPPDSIYSKELTFSQCLLGSLFIRSYRLFSLRPEHNLAILFQKCRHTTHYLYLMYLPHCGNSLLPSETHSLRKCIEEVDTMRSAEQVEYRVVLCYFRQGKSLEMEKDEFTRYLEGQVEVGEWREAERGRSGETEGEGLMMVGKQELSKLMEVVWTYIDTFGTRHKNNIYADLCRRNPTSFNLQKLLSTIDWIVYMQTINYNCNQIETANWTCFEMKAKGNFQCDRKDIVMTGHGCIKMIHLLLLETVQHHQKEYQRQMKQLIADCRKNYANGIIKGYTISDQLLPHGIIYVTSNHLLKEFALEKRE